MKKIYLVNLKTVLVGKKVDQHDLARKAGVNQPHISKLATLKSPGSLDTVYRIAEALDVSIDYLVGREASAPAQVEVKVGWPGKLQDPSLLEERQEDYLPIPIVSPRVAAGSPRFVSREDVIDIAFVHRRTVGRHSVRDFVCTFVEGDSMEPILHSGAIVGINTAARPDKAQGGNGSSWIIPEGSVWAVRHGEGTVIKHIQIRDGMIVLISHNTSYPIDLVREPDAIIGRVEWVWQRM